MNTEEAIQQHLDQHPDDYFAREVLADLLDELGDPRAAGYRALGRWRIVPDMEWGWRYVYTVRTSLPPNVDRDRSIIPFDWYAIVDGCQEDHPEPRLQLKYQEGRKEAEDKLAEAFGRLPQTRQTELLQREVV